MEVHRTPSTGSWLGMVRRRIAGAAEEDEDAGRLMRSASLPKQRRSSQGATLRVRARPPRPALPQGSYPATPRGGDSSPCLAGTRACLGELSLCVCTSACVSGVLAAQHSLVAEDIAVTSWCRSGAALRREHVSSRTHAEAGRRLRRPRWCWPPCSWSG